MGRDSGMLHLRVALLLGALALGAVGALAGRRTRDHDLAPADPRRPLAVVPRERVLEVARVVALGAIRVEPLVRAARFTPLESGARHRLRDVELEAELDRREPFRIPCGRAILQAHAPDALAQRGDRAAGLLDLRVRAVDAAAALHRERHLVAQL